jgi:aldehyde:ferredoxin oxidoreductase
VPIETEIVGGGPDAGQTRYRIDRRSYELDDLALDAASTGSAIAWAMELYQRGIIDQKTTGGLDLTWGNYPAIEQLLFLTAKREGFGDTIAASSRAVELGKYPAEAMNYCMASKGLFQSDPHDARILKAFALGLAVATRGMDHLRNRATLEINARINDDAGFKTALYGGVVSPQPTSYEGKEYAVRRCENTFAAGDAIGMCRFNTKLFNSPSTPDLADFSTQIRALTQLSFNEEQLDEVGRNITGLERMLNYRLGLRQDDDTLPDRWFDEPIQVGPFKGEKIDRAQFAALKERFYQLTGLNQAGTPALDWHALLSKVVTGYSIKVKFPCALPGAPEQSIIVDEPIAHLGELRQHLRRKLPEANDILDDPNLNIVIDGKMILAGENQTEIPDGSEVYLVSYVSGG